MEIYPKDFCIFVASHISKQKRINLLLQCLHSLIKQNMVICIYVSISFENKTLMDECIHKISQDECINNCAFLNILVRENKCSQMQHIYLLFEETNKNHKWMMFCDDDDEYLENRSFKIGEQVVLHEHQIKNTEMELAGIYESTFGKNHREHGHEYWCYCVHKDILLDFFHHLKDKQEIIEHPCCDVLFSAYLRRKGNKWLFGRLQEKQYMYRENNNDDSVTHFITSQQNKYTNLSVPPSKDSNEWDDYVKEYNHFLNENMHAFMHDLFVLSISGIEFDVFLKREFLANYAILDYVDQNHIHKLKEKHKNWTTIFQSMYEIK